MLELDNLIAVKSETAPWFSNFVTTIGVKDNPIYRSECRFLVLRGLFDTVSSSSVAED